MWKTIQTLSHMRFLELGIILSKLIYKKDKFYIKEQTHGNILADVSTLDCIQLCGGMVTSPLYRSDTTEKMIPIVAHVAKKVS